MAEVITKFKLETSQYDSKLRDSAKSLKSLTEKLQMAGNDFNKFAQNSVESARALGKIESGATSVKDQLKDLVGAYNDVAKAYNNLTKEQQQTDFGRAMAGSLQQLQQRITDTKSEVYSLGDSAKESGSCFEGLSSVLGGSITKIGLLGGAVGIAKGAIDVATDAFNQSESNIDEWGRTVEGAKGAYDVFLNTINSGNWSSFFDNMSTAIKGARELYDALDRLGSVKSNNQAAIAIQQQQVAQLRLMKQQGQNVDAQLKAATERLAQLQQQAVNAGKNAGSKMVGNVIRNAYNTGEGANGQLGQKTLDRVTNEILTQGQAAFDKYAKQVQMFEQMAKDTRMVSQTNGAGINTSYEETFVNLNKLTQEQQRQYNLAKAITEGESRIQAGISTYAQAVQEGAQSAREEFKGNRYAAAGNGGNGKKGGGTKGTGKQEITYADDSIMAQEKLVQELTLKWKTASGELREGYLKDLKDAQTQLDKMNGKNAKQPQEMAVGTSGFNDQNIANWVSMIKGDLAKADIGSEIYQSLTDNLSDMSRLTTSVKDAIKLGLDIPQEAVEEMFETVFAQGNLPEDMYNDMIQKFIADFKEKTGKDLEIGEGGKITVSSKGKDDKEDKQNKSLVEGIGQLTGGMNTMVSSMEQLGIKIPSGLKDVLGSIQSVCTLLSTISTIVSAIEAISAADMFIPFASGGIVGRAASGLLVGNNMSGDNLRMPVLGGSGGMIGINDGELILNKAQQGIIADSLQGSGLENLNLETIITAEDLIVMLNNNANRRGMEPFIKD